MVDEELDHMSGVQKRIIDGKDSEKRLDRWFKQNFPNIGRSLLEKLLRTGQIRVDGGRAKAKQRLIEGQSIRLPPLDNSQDSFFGNFRKKRQHRRDLELEKELARRILMKDEEFLVIDKPPGLAVQGGTATTRHVDGVLDGLKFGFLQRPRLVHRLDKDTSGILLLARTSDGARWLTQAFRNQLVEKTYWGIVLGEVRPRSGIVDLPISKLKGRTSEKMGIDRKNGQTSITEYKVIEKLGNRAAWVVMKPRTGRTHQLRIHMMALGTPILGDGKFGGKAAFLETEGLSNKLHLHARRISFKKPDGTTISVEAPLPEHMLSSWNYFGFDKANGFNF